MHYVRNRRAFSDVELKLLIFGPMMFLKNALATVHS